MDSLLLDVTPKPRLDGIFALFDNRSRHCRHIESASGYLGLNTRLLSNIVWMANLDQTFFDIPRMVETRLILRYSTLRFSIRYR